MKYDPCKLSVYLKLLNLPPGGSHGDAISQTISTRFAFSQVLFWPVGRKNLHQNTFTNTSPFLLRDLGPRATQQTLKDDFEAYLDAFSPNVQDILIIGGSAQADIAQQAKEKICLNKQ